MAFVQIIETDEELELWVNAEFVAGWAHKATDKPKTHISIALAQEMLEFAVERGVTTGEQQLRAEIKKIFF